MIRLARCTQASKAGTYFRLHLNTGDNPSNPAAPLYWLRAAWIGPALRDVGLAPLDPPAASHLVRLGRGLHPTEKPRLAPAINRKRAYYDLTVAAPKTVTLAALLEHGHITAQSVLDAHKNAVEAIAKALGGMVEPRSGTGPAKWLGAVFHHTHSREGDPHLHSHIILPNIAMNHQGQWRAIQVKIAGLNRTRLGLIYGHQLARSLRRRGLGGELLMRESGLPEIGCLLKIAPRFSKARRAVLKTDGNAERARAAQSPGKPGSRPNPSGTGNRARLRRRQRLADEMRRPKNKDSDNPVKLGEEALRWRRALTNEENRELIRLLDGADYTNPRRPTRVIDKLPPPAAAVVRAAYRRIPERVKRTEPVLMRAAVAESAGWHEYEDLQKACEASLVSQREALRRVRAFLDADSVAIAIAALARASQGRRSYARPQREQAVTPVSQPNLTPVSTGNKAGR